jgi:hypothetical protein
MGDTVVEREGVVRAPFASKIEPFDQDKEP